jgi:adsorption protein B
VNALPFAILIPAWEESDVIGDMLDAALISYKGDDVHLFVGCYPNDAETPPVVRLREGPRLSLVIVDRDGGTTKAHCLNNLYRAMLAFEVQQCRLFADIVLHDAEDVVSPREIEVFCRNIERFGMIQLPVFPLPNPKSRWIGGHYCDEFAEAHGKTMLVRQALGAALPSAGVGCVIRRDVLAAFAERSVGAPFCEDSLTEDYELGLRMRDLGFTSAFIEEEDDSDPGFVCTQAYFPDRLCDAVKQKARWMAGIGLDGWSRLGWGSGWAEVWMRARDRRGLTAALLLLAAYLALLLALLLLGAQLREGRSFPVPQGFLAVLLSFNAATLIWRLSMRYLYSGRFYGYAKAAIAIPRAIVGNLIAILASIRAVGLHLASLRTGRVHWDKTKHIFPANTP